MMFKASHGVVGTFTARKTSGRPRLSVCSAAFACPWRPRQWAASSYSHEWHAASG